MEFFWLRQRFRNAWVWAAVVVVVTGVGIVTVTDLGLGGLGYVGIMIAAISVVSSGMQQILCGQVQRKFSLSSTQLLSNSAPIQVRGGVKVRGTTSLTRIYLAATTSSSRQGLMLLIVGPLLDWYITGKWVLDYRSSPPSLQMLGLSCTVAIMVNVSQFMCLGRFSAITFQVRIGCDEEGGSDVLLSDSRCCPPGSSGVGPHQDSARARHGVVVDGRCHDGTQSPGDGLGDSRYDCVRIPKQRAATATAQTFGFVVSAIFLAILLMEI